MLEAAPNGKTASTLLILVEMLIDRLFVSPRSFLMTTSKRGGAVDDFHMSNAPRRNFSCFTR